MKLQFEIDEEMINLIPPATKYDRDALRNDIIKRIEVLGEDKAISQNILLGPDGRCIDGRTRLTILAELGVLVPKEKITMLEMGTSKEEVMMEVRSANSRRNLTTTQKATVAYRTYLASKNNDGGKKLTLKEIAKEYAIGYTTMKNLHAIAKYNPDFEHALWSGHTVEIVDQNGNETKTSSINSVRQHIERIKEHGKISETDIHEWNENSAIKTQAGKDWYYNKLKYEEVTSIQHKLDLIELANYKFKAEVL
jgi:hypothetical protein